MISGWFMALIQSLSAKQGRPSWVTSWPCRDQTAITEASPKSAPAATHEPGIGFLMLKAVERMPWPGKIAKIYCQTMPSNEMLACILYTKVTIGWLHSHIPWHPDRVIWQAQRENSFYLESVEKEDWAGWEKDFSCLVCVFDAGMHQSVLVGKLKNPFFRLCEDTCN